MHGCRKKTRVLCVMTMLNVFVFILVGVSRNLGQDKGDQRKPRVPSRRFWRKQMTSEIFWNKEQQRLDYIYNPILMLGLTNDSLLELPDWLNDTKSPDPCQPDYRVTTQVKDYNSLPPRFQDFLLHMHCRSYPMIMDQPRVCESKPYLLLAVKSLAPHFDRRQAIRESWGRVGVLANRTIATVFLLGNAAAVDHFPNLSGMLSHEARLYGDLLQWDYRDSFFNLTLKEVLFLDWFSQRCPDARFVFKGDDDVFVNTWRILDFLHNLPEIRARDLFIGDVITNAGPHRDRKLKYFIPESVFVGPYPPYAGGGGFLYSGELALQLHNISQQVALYPIDDVYTGMCLQKLGLVPEKHKGFRTFDIHEKYRGNPCAYKSLMLVHSRTPQEMIKIWAWLSDPELDYDHLVDEGNAFFALRSCHQVMRGKSGEFFSPDYLCSNPPLWCNWTIQVDPGKRVLLHLEDFTQSDACSGKLDQIHLDEPLGVAGGHRILEKCWREAKYRSLSNILHVVQLIRGKPSPPHRGFYGRYEAFVPPVTYNAYGDTTEEDRKLMTEPNATELEPFPPLRSFSKFLPMKGGEPTEAILLERPTPPAQTNPEMVFDYFDQLTSSSVSNELPSWEAEEPMVREGPFKFYPFQREEGDWNRGISEGTGANESHLTKEDWEVGNLSGDGIHGPPHLLFTPTPPMVFTRQGTSWSGRGDTQTHTAHPGSDPSHQLPVLNPKPSPRTPSAMRRNVDAQTTNTIPPTESNIVSHTTDVDDQGEESGNKELLKMTMGESTASSATRTPTETQDPFDHLPDMVEPFFDSRQYNHLFEVAVEVNFLVAPEENWDHLVRSLLISVKSLINVQLEIIHKPKTLSSKRIKRLSAGVLYILWLYIGGGPEGVNVQRTLHPALQELLERVVSSTQGVIVSVSTADVNECVTQLVLCDINAECVNRFGSYACRCHSGFEDMSRLGSGGTICVDTKAAGCTSEWSSGMIKGIYVVCFLFSFLILLLLCTVGVLYHRHHWGAFLVHCRRSSLGSIPPPDYKNSSICTNSVLPPPIRRPKEGWAHPKDCCPSVDLPLLRFSPLLPLDGYMEPGEGVKL